MWSFRRFLLCTCLTTFALPALAQEAPARKPLQARVEGNLRAGTERSIAMTEFWVPIVQDAARGSVLYGDARFMGDDKENNEFNLGVGYRQQVSDVPVLGDGVAGIHGWVDRRHTERDSTFNQITAGVEWYGAVVDIKANAYLPLTDEKHHAAGTMATSAPYLAGSGIFYDAVNMSVVEEAQPGLDFELGFNVSGIVDGFSDSTRVYAGAYHFAGDKTDNVTGWRARIASDITEDIQIGARFQRDDERGSQGFLEATIRFPFGNKQSYKQSGLYARLDESPERDIDIVTSSSQPVVTSAAAPVPVLNANSGTAQRVLYVDNTAAGGGTGSKDSPFNTLAAAQAALLDNDVVYIARGDGTSTNMNTGFALNRHNVSLIGEGSAFVYDGGKFTTAASANFSGTVLKAAGLAPVITNPTPAANINAAFVTGAGIYTTTNLNNVSISGINIANTGGVGLYLGMNSGTAHVSNVTITNPAYDGLHIGASNADLIEVRNVSVSGVLAAGRYGLVAYSSGNGGVGAIRFSDVTLNNNPLNFRIYSNINAVIDSVELDRVTATNATGAYDGTIGTHSNATINNLRLNDVTTNSTRPNGMIISGANSGKINAATITNLQSRNHSSSGLLISTANDSYIHNTTIQNSAFTGNTYGVYLNDDSTAAINVTLSANNNLAGNVTNGLRLDLDGGAVNAQGNWWGQAGGPIGAQVANEAACPACGTADTSNARATAP